MALNTNKGSQLQVKFGTLQTYVSGEAFYRGAIIALRLDAGKVYAVAEDDSDTNKQLVVGYSREQAKAADEDIRIQREGRFLLGFTGGTPVLGSLACVFDDNTVQAYDAAKGNIVVGRILQVLSNTQVYVDVGDRPKRKAESIYD